MSISEVGNEAMRLPEPRHGNSDSESLAPALFNSESRTFESQSIPDDQLQVLAYLAGRYDFGKRSISEIQLPDDADRQQEIKQAYSDYVRVLELDDLVSQASHAGITSRQLENAYKLYLQQSNFSGSDNQPIAPQHYASLYVNKYAPDLELETNTNTRDEIIKTYQNIFELLPAEAFYATQTLRSGEYFSANVAGPLAEKMADSHIDSDTLEKAYASHREITNSSNWKHEHRSFFEWKNEQQKIINEMIQKLTADRLNDLKNTGQILVDPEKMEATLADILKELFSGHESIIGDERFKILLQKFEELQAEKGSMQDTTTFMSAEQHAGTSLALRTKEKLKNVRPVERILVFMGGLAVRSSVNVKSSRPNEMSPFISTIPREFSDSYATDESLAVKLPETVLIKTAQTEYENTSDNNEILPSAENSVPIYNIFNELQIPKKYHNDLMNAIGSILVDLNLAEYSESDKTFLIEKNAKESLTFNFLVRKILNQIK